jgi:hypothetical protein
MVVAAVDEDGYGYGDQAAASAVMNIFNFLVAQPTASLQLPYSVAAMATAASVPSLDKR